MISVIIFAVVCVMYYVKFRSKRKLLYDLSRSLPDIGTLPIIGHMHWFVGGPEKMLTNIDKLVNMIEDSGGIGKVWLGPQLYLVILNPEDVQKVLENCLQKDWSYKFLQVWLGNGLFVAPVDIWRVHRRVLLSVFQNRVVNENVEVFGEQGQVLVSLLEGEAGGKSFDVFKYITSCTLDIVFETAMGERMDVQHKQETPYLRARNIVMSIINMRLFKAWLQPDFLFKLTPYSKIQADNINITHDFTDKVIKKKRASIKNYNSNVYKGRRDILERLVGMQASFTDEQLREHIDSITIAGNDTTALVIAYTLVMLGSHPEEQDNVYRELKTIFGDSKRPPTKEDLHKMDYLERVIKETMRLYTVVPIIGRQTQLKTIFGDSKRPPTKEDLHKMDYLERVIKETMRLYTVVPIIGRQTQSELQLSNCTIPADVGCAILPFWMHKSKKIWGPDADQFKPDRFLSVNSVNRHPCAFIPFSFGSRNCIGRHFGMLAMKSILSNVLRSYKIKADLCRELKIEILLFPVKGHKISIEKR